MKYLIQFSRVVVGALFVFSGFVKIVDPIGTAIKLDEYFIIFSDNFSPIFSVFIPHVVALSVFITTLEIVLGVALLLSYQPKTTLYLLFGQILFFTALTFYSYKTGEVTDCGCFGDAIPLDPKESFYKDLILTFLISLLVLYRNQLKPIAFKKGSLLIGVMTVTCLVFANYNLNHLPVIDFRPYAVGEDIVEKSNDGKPGVFHYRMKRGEEEKVFEVYQTEGGWEYVGTVEIEKGKLPSINDFNSFNELGDETTADLLTGNQLLLISQNIDDINIEEQQGLKMWLKAINTDSFEMTLLTGSSFEKSKELLKKIDGDMSIAVIDEVVIKAMIRSNPGVMMLKDGVVKGKWHFNDLPQQAQLIGVLQ